jgi:hypothetical protein
MKKKFNWIYLVLIFIFINIVREISVNDDGEWTIGKIFPLVAGFFIFSSVIRGIMNQPKSTKNETLPEEPPAADKPDPKTVNTYATQNLYDEDSFKIDPDDYKI